VKEASSNKGYEAESNALKHNITIQKQVISLKKQITKRRKQFLSIQIRKNNTITHGS